MLTPSFCSLANKLTSWQNKAKVPSSSKDPPARTVNLYSQCTTCAVKKGSMQIETQHRIYWNDFMVNVDLKTREKSW